MSQMDELRVFVCERLHAITTQILGAIEKTINNYEEQTTRLKEENDRQRALLDNVLKAKIPQIKGWSSTACDKYVRCIISLVFMFFLGGVSV